MRSPESSEYYTYTDYELWEGKWELINGVPYNMSPAPSTKHQHIVGEVYFALRSHIGQKNGVCRVFVAPFDVRLSEDDDYLNPDTVIQPDISVICNPKQITEKGGKGAPHLVVEVLSPSTALKDRNEKFRLYEKHGVKEYWIIDPVHQTIEIYAKTKDIFDIRKVFGKDDRLTSFIFEDFSLELTNIFH